MTEKHQPRGDTPRLLLIVALSIMALLSTAGLIVAGINDGGTALALIQILAIIICAGGAVLIAVERKRSRSST